jgi:WD40 repeat protein
MGVLAGGDTGTVYWWDIEDGRLLRTWTSSGPIEALACSPDGQTLAVAVGESSTVLLHLADGQIIRTLPESGQGGMAFTPDGHTLAMATGHVNQLWDLVSGQKQDLSEWGSADAIALSPDGQVLAARSGEYLRLWRVADGAALARFPATVSRISFAPDGRALVTTGLYDQDVQVWTVR